MVDGDSFVHHPRLQLVLYSLLGVQVIDRVGELSYYAATSVCAEIDSKLSGSA